MSGSLDPDGVYATWPLDLWSDTTRRTNRIKIDHCFALNWVGVMSIDHQPGRTPARKVRQVGRTSGLLSHLRLPHSERLANERPACRFRTSGQLARNIWINERRKARKTILLAHRVQVSLIRWATRSTWEYADIANPLLWRGSCSLRAATSPTNTSLRQTGVVLRAFGYETEA